MIEQLHSHLLKDMEQAGKEDTTFVLSAVFFNIMVLAVNSAVVQGESPSSTAIFIIFTFGSLLVTSSALAAIRNASKACAIYHNALMNIYEENSVAKYWPKELSKNAGTRLRLYMLIVSITGLIAILIPLIAGY
jgi:hypothetical protein